MNKTNRKNSEIEIYGPAFRFNLKGNTLTDYKTGLEEVFDFLGQHRNNPDSSGKSDADEPEEAYLQTFTNVMYRDELEFFLQNGFYINRVMLFMELDIKQFTANSTDLVNKAFRDGLCRLEGFDKPAVMELYDHEAGLDEYLEANALGFGEPDPVNQLKEELAYDNAAIYVARHEGRIVSSVTVWDLSDKVIATENIFTVPDRRELGLAKNLLVKVISTKAVNGAETARLSVFGDDLEALSLYYGLGFKLVSEKYELRY